MDGIRAQARQARRSQCAAARRRRRALLAHRRRRRALAERPLRHHARQRFAAAARRGAQAGRDDGASAQPSALRRGAESRHRAATRSCSRASAACCRSAARRRTRVSSAATPASIPTRVRFRTPIRISSAKARSSARASTTSTRSSASLADRFPGQPHPQPRSARRLLRALGPRDRHRALRGISEDLSRRRATPPSLDARRLADRRNGCFRRVPIGNGERARNPLSALSRWKIFDNLRRSLVPIALVALLAIGWFASPSPGFWAALVIEVLLVPLVLDLALVDRKPERRGRLAAIRQELIVDRSAARLAQVAIAAGVPAVRSVAQPRCDRAHVLARARVAAPSAAVDRHPAQRRRESRGLGSHHRSHGRLRRSWRSSSLCSSLHSASARVRRCRGSSPGSSRRCSSGCSSTAPKRRAQRARSPRRSRFCATSRGAPGVSSSVSSVTKITGCRPTTIRNIRSRRPRIARRRRTSASICCRRSPRYDFGYLSLRELIERLTRSFETLERLPRHRGHFYNWYDTLTLQPLAPLYVSTVDSGNLIAHLADVAPGPCSNGCTAGSGHHAGLIAGLRDTLAARARARSRTRSRCLDAARSRRVDARPRSHVAPPMRDAGEFARARRRAGSCAGSQRRRPPRAICCRRCVARSHRAIADARVLLRRGAARRRRRFVRRCSTSAASAGRRPARTRAAGTRRALESLAVRCGDLARVDFDFLFDAGRSLFAIGYNVSEHRRDAGFYDLLASEARLGIFVAIAQGSIAQDAWFSLGRLLTSATGRQVLLSWSGSMFEYLMPQLVMPSFQDTLLDETCRLRRRAPDRLRARQGRAVGHFGVGLQRHRRRAELPVPRVRRAGPRPAARPRAGARHRAVCERRSR